MKIVVAIDSLKGSLTSIQAGEAIEKGIKKVDLEAEVVIKPLADGGEGCLDAQTAMGKAPSETCEEIWEISLGILRGSDQRCNCLQ